MGSNACKAEGITRFPNVSNTFTGEVIKSPESECELEWRIPNFDPAMKNNEVYISPGFSFAQETCNLFMSATFDNLFVGLSRKPTIPNIILEVSVALKTLNGKKDQKKCIKNIVSSNGREAYYFNNYLRLSEFLEKKSDLLPSNVLTLIYTLKLRKTTEDANADDQKCSHCNEIVNAADISSHEKKCLNKPIKCPDCSIVVALKNWHDHECQPTEAKGFIDWIAYILPGLIAWIGYGLREFIGFSSKVLPVLNVWLDYGLIELINWTDYGLRGLIGWIRYGLRAKGSSFGSSISPHVNKVLHDLKRLFLEKEDCDVILKVQGQEFSAHRNILKSRSSVFASTFRTDMKEKKTGVVEIEDCDPSSFSDFLCFIYCGDSGVISKENVFSLFTAADKYDVQDLRTKCVTSIKENISIDTFCDTITLALRHCERELIQLTTDFFIENASAIILTVKWQSFLAENPTEGNELLVKFFASKTSNPKE